MLQYGPCYSQKPFSILLGKTLSSVTRLEAGSDCVTFTCTDGTEYVMNHAQDCCETVTINDIVGNVADLLGTPLTMADNPDSGDAPRLDEWDESFTWTFYKLATVKGYVDIRWYGTSNGYYSESVEFWQSAGPLES